MDNLITPNSNDHPTEDEIINKQRAFWAAIIFTAVALISFVFSIFLMGRSPIWQVYTISVISFIALIVDIVGTVLIWQDRTALGLKLLYWSVLFTLPPNALLVTGVTPILIAIVLVVGFVHVFYLQPRAWRKYYQFGPIVASVIMAVFEFLQPSFQVTLTDTTTPSGYFGQSMLVFLVASLLALIVRQAWGGNIRVKIVTAFTIVALVSLGILGTVTYFNYRNQVREDIRQRLLNIASVSAIQLDGDLHAALQAPEDMQTEAYQQMLALGDEIVASDPDLIYAYTMRMNEQGQIYFIIDSRRADDTERDPIGTVYEEPSETLQAFFNAPDRPVVEEEIYTDIYGSVLSAFAPFYRADGSLEGVWGVDIAADVVLEQERNVLYLILGTIGASMAIVTLLGLWLGNVFTRPILNLASVAQQVAEGDLGVRSEVETTDEVGDLARVFNTMTSQLQETLQGWNNALQSAPKTWNWRLKSVVRFHRCAIWTSCCEMPVT